jgi:hypothetical protein
VFRFLCIYVCLCMRLYMYLCVCVYVYVCLRPSAGAYNNSSNRPVCFLCVVYVLSVCCMCVVCVFERVLFELNFSFAVLSQDIDQLHHPDLRVCIACISVCGSVCVCVCVRKYNTDTCVSKFWQRYRRICLLCRLFLGGGSAAPHRSQRVYCIHCNTTVTPL